MLCSDSGCVNQSSSKPFLNINNTVCCIITQPDLKVSTFALLHQDHCFHSDYKFYILIDTDYDTEMRKLHSINQTHSLQPASL